MFRIKTVLPRFRCLLATGLAVLALLTSAPFAHATSSYGSTWSSLHPNSTSDNNAGCQLCHGSSTQNINPYGLALAQCNGASGSITARIQAVEGQNSDGDSGGFTNLQEANANSQPGWTTGSMQVWNRGSCNSAGTNTYPGSGDVDPAAANLPPVADANGPYSGTVGTSVSFDGTGSSDPDGTITSYAWNFGDGNNGTGATPSHTYATAGNYTVTLTVTDDGGLTDSATSTANIGAGNVPPIADANGPYNGTAGQQVNFDGSGSTDSDGTIVAYDWTFGDGGTGTGVSPVHTYAAAGTYNVSLVVTDDAGDSSTPSNSMATIVAAPVDPIADPNGPYSGFEGQAVAFDGSGSNDPDGGNITQYLWNFGDGNTGTGVAPSHTYATAGTYTVTLTVVDDEGAQSASATTTATIDVPPDNLPPVSDPNGPYSGTTGQAVSFDGSGSSDADGTIASYAWDFGDGASGSGVSPSHAYAAPGTYTVSLTVTDNEGATNAASSTATIQDAVVVDCNGELDIDRSSWSNRRSRLRVEGDGGQRNAGDFVLSNAYDLTQVLATGSESRDREFDFRVYGPDPVPCVIRVEQPGSGRCAIAEVDNAPSSCAPVDPPTANIPPTSDPNGPYEGATGQAVSFDGSGSTDSDGTIVAYDWNFGDGNTGTGVSPSHAYAAEDSYTVSLTVTDNDGASDTATTTADITDEPPVAGVTARGDTYATPVGNTLTIKASRVSGVLYNDFGGEPPLTVQLVDGPMAGSLVLDVDGSGGFTYTPDGTMVDNSVDSFTYIAIDANGVESAEATVTIQTLSKQTDFKILMNYELGMHCTGFEFAYCCVLPPYNSIIAQVVKPAQNDPACAQDEDNCRNFFDGYPRMLEGSPVEGLDGLGRETVVRDWDYTDSSFKKYQLRYYHDAQPRQEGNTSKPNESSLISNAEGNSLQYFNTVFDSAAPDGGNALVYGEYNGYSNVVQGDGSYGGPTDNYANGWLNHFYIYGNLEGHGNTGLEADKVRLGVAGQVEYPPNSGAALQPLGPTGNGTSFENVLTFSADTGTVVFTQAKVLEDLPIMLTSPRIWEALGMPLTPFEDTIGFFADPGAVDEDTVRPFVAMKASLHEYPSGNAVTGSNGQPVIGFGTAPIDIPNCERCHSAPSVDPATGNPNVNSPNYNRPDYSYPFGGPLAGTGLEDMTNLEINFWQAYYDIVPGVDSTWYSRLKGAAINMLTLHDYDVGTSFTANYAGTECVDPNNCVGGPLTNESDIPQNTRLGNESVICQRCHADNVIANVKSATFDAEGQFPIKPISEAIHNQHRNQSEGGVIVFNDSLGRDGGCQGCHPAHRSDGVMDDYPITLGGNNVNADGDNRLNLGGCFVGRDVHSNPMKDVDGAETPTHLNAVGSWLADNVTHDQGDPRGIWCTNCHTQLGQEMWRTEDCNDLIRGDCLVNPRGEPTLEDVAAAVGLTPQEAIDMLDPKVAGFDRTTDQTHRVWDPATPDANVATIEVDGGGNPVVTTDADGDISVNILSFCTTDDCVSRINANKGNQSAWRYPVNAFIDPVNNSGAAVPFSAATDGRDHWLSAGEPHCADCHKAPYVEQSGNVTPYPPFNYPAKASLMRYTRGHQDISCQGCHESIHGLYPVTPTIDTTTYAQAAALNNDGSHGPIKCEACHTFVDNDGIPNWVDNLRYNDPTSPGDERIRVQGSFDTAVSWMHTYTDEANPNQDVCRNCHGSETPEADDDEYLEHAMTNRVSRVAMDNAERAVNNGRVFGEVPGRQRNDLCSECHDDHDNLLDEVSCGREWRRHLIQGRVSQIVWEDVSNDRTGSTCGW